MISMPMLDFRYTWISVRNGKAIELGFVLTLLLGFFCGTSTQVQNYLPWYFINPSDNSHRANTRDSFYLT